MKIQLPVEVFVDFKAFEERLMNRILFQFEILGRKIMANQAELKERLGTLAVAIASERQQFTTFAESTKNAVAALEQKLANAGTPVDLSEEIALVNEAIAGIEGIVENSPVQVPVVPPTTVDQATGVPAPIVPEEALSSLTVNGENIPL